jgi:DNA-binding MarR family transcriptional regulator
MEQLMKNINMTSEDIILMHLYRYRSHQDDRRLPYAVCQEGIGKTEGLSIANVSQGVKNLIYSGFVIFEKRYIETKRNPCMAYSLTPLGESRAKIIELFPEELKKSIVSKGVKLRDVALLNRRDRALAIRAKDLKANKG